MRFRWDAFWLFAFMFIYMEEYLIGDVATELILPANDVVPVEHMTEIPMSFNSSFEGGTHAPPRLRLQGPWLPSPGLNRML